MKLLLITDLLKGIWENTGFTNLHWDNGIMILAGLILILLSIRLSLIHI